MTPLESVQAINTILRRCLPTFFYAMFFVVLYFAVLELLPVAKIGGLLTSCTTNTYNATILFASSPFNYEEILVIHTVYSVPLQTLLQDNFFLPILLILATGLYLEFFTIKLKNRFTIHSAFWLSVASSYIISLGTWHFGGLLLSANNCPSTGTSIIGVCLAALLGIGLFIDCLSLTFNRHTLKPLAIYLIPIALPVWIAVVYVGNGIIHLFGLIVFALVILVYLKYLKSVIDRRRF